MFSRCCLNPSTNVDSQNTVSYLNQVPMIVLQATPNSSLSLLRGETHKHRETHVCSYCVPLFRSHRVCFGGEGVNDLPFPSSKPVCKKRAAYYCFVSTSASQSQLPGVRWLSAAQNGHNLHIYRNFPNIFFFTLTFCYRRY